MYHSEPVKVSTLLYCILVLSVYPVQLVAIQCQLSAAVHKLWPWCIIDQTLLISVLLMLGTFTAHCAKG